MTRFADPSRCPGCGAPMGSVTVCAQCGISFVTPQARQLWAALNQADALVAHMQGMAALDTLAPLPQAPVLPVRPRRRSWSVGSVILALGALCILVAAFVFISIAWIVLGQTGRTLVLLLVTAAAAVIASKVTARGLRASAETMWAIVAGMFTLDFFAARAYGIFGLDHLSTAHSLLLFGPLLAAGGLAVARNSRSKLRTPLVLAQMAVVVGTYCASLGVQIDGLEQTYVALIAVVVGLVPTALLWLSQMRAAAAATAFAATIAYVIAFFAAVDSVLQTSSLAQLWGGPAWTMVAAVAATIVLGVGGQIFAKRAAPAYTAAAGMVAAAIATMGVAVVLFAPFSDLKTEVARQLVIVAFAVGPLALATILRGPWGIGVRIAAVALALPLVVTGLEWILSEAAANVANATGAGEWGAQGNVRLAIGQSSPPGWLAAVVLIGLAVCTLLISVWPVRPTIAPPAVVRHQLLGATVALLAAAVLSQLAVNPVPVIALAAALAACTALLLWWATTRSSRLAAAAGISVAALAALTPLASASATMTIWAALCAITAVGARQSLRDESLRVVQRVLAGAAVALLLGTVAAAAHTAALPIRWEVFTLTAAAALAGLGAQALRRWPDSRLVAEAVVAAITVFALVWAAADTSLGWQSLLWTITGASLVVVALVSNDRRIVAAAGSATLAVAYILRLAASDVGVVEAYTLPIGAALVVAGCVAMVIKPRLGSWTAVGAGLSLSLLPSLPQVLDDPTTVRGLLLGAGAVIVLAAGVLRRWQAPFVMGAALTGLLVIRQLGPVADAVPRWMLIGTVGIVLLYIGITWESRVRNAKSVADYVTAMR